MNREKRDGRAEGEPMARIDKSGGRRVLILMDDLGGGTGNHVFSMARHWDRSAWRIEVIGSRAVSARVAPDLEVHELPPPGWGGVYPFAQVARVAELRKRVLARRPELVHAYFFWSILYGRILKKLGAIPRLLENREDHGFNWGRHEYGLLRLTRSAPDRVICVSESVRRTVLEREGLDPNRVLVVPNGTEPVGAVGGTDTELRRELGFGEGDRVVGMVSNLNRPIKGVAHFLDAIPAILRGAPEARFLIVGRGREEGALREKARALGVDRYIVFAGFRKEIERFYRVMDVSVLTSLSEGLSLTLLESMAHGLPVVVTRVGGNPEVVIDGETGFLVPPKDPARFAERVALLLRDPDLRARMGRAGRERVEAHFALEKAARRYTEIYESLIASSPA
ncbi:MAG: glycosyltransferase family 4 protein [Candidatus Eisenbacteria bacterium]